MAPHLLEFLKKVWWLNPYFCTKANDNVKFNFILCSIFIINNWNASLVIVIAFGAKIWIQSPNLFQKFQHVWRQLHLLSIVDYPNFQCSWLFLGLLMFFEWGKIFQAHFLGSISQKIWSFCMGWLICLKLQHLPTWHNHTNRTKK